MANNFEINLPAQSFIIPASGGCARGVTQNRPVLAFDAAAQESSRSPAFQMPAAYTGSGTLKVDIHYAMASATSGTVNFEVSVEAITPGDAVDLITTESFDSVNSGSATVPGTAKTLGLMTITLANKDSVAAGDYVRLKVDRDGDDAGSDDSASGDVYVLLVVVREEA